MIKPILLSSILAFSLFANDDMLIVKKTDSDSFGKGIEQIIKIKDYGKDFDNLNDRLEKLENSLNKNKSSIEISKESLKKENESTKVAIAGFVEQYEKQIAFNKLTNESVNNIIKVLDENTKNVAEISKTLKVAPDYVQTLQKENKILKEELENLKNLILKIENKSNENFDEQSKATMDMKKSVETKLNENIISIKSEIDKVSTNIDFDSNLENHELLLFIIKNITRINERIDFIQNNVIDYKFSDKYDPNVYSQYNTKSKITTEYKSITDKTITNVYFGGTKIIGKAKDGYVETSSGVLDIKDLSLIEQ